VALRVEGPLDAGILALCLAEIVRRHEALRTVFARMAGAPVQVIRPAAPFRLPVIDLSGLPDREAVALRLAADEAARPFDLTRGPLLRVVLLRLTREDHLAALTMHHIVSDGWSVGLLVREVGTLYAAFAEGRPSPLPELPVQYPDFAVWQGSWLRDQVLESEIAWWRRQLAGLPPLLALPTDRPRPGVQSFRGALRPLRLPEGLTRQLQALGRREGATLFMVLLAGFQALLARHSGQGDFAVGTPVAGRNQVEIEGMIGFFVNTLVLRSDLTGNPTFRELLGRVRDTTLIAQAHQEVPFEKLIQELAPERSLAHTPLFQVVLALQNAPAGSLEIRNLRLRPVEATGTTAKFDLTLNFVEHGGGLGGTVEHATDLFDAATIDRLLLQYERLLAAALEAPERAASELPLLSSGERHQMLREWNDTAVDRTEDTLIHELFESWAERTPGAVAAVCGGEALTYGELRQQAHRLAHHLAGLGIGPGSLVGIHLRRGLRMLPAVLAVLEVGAAYVPLEVGHPPARLQWVLGALDVSCVLTEAAQLGSLPALPHLICLDQIGLEGSAPPPPRSATPDDLAYIIFTSGSTGTPKGVMVRHRPVVNLFRWAYRTFAFSPADRVLCVASLSFDLSVFDIFGLLGAGGSVRIATEEEIRDPERLLRALAEEPITFWNSAPAALEQTVPFLSGDPQVRPALRLVFLSGDWIPVTLPDRFRERFPGARMISLGGATEATVWSNVFPIERVDPAWTSIPYGRPIENARYHVLDAHLVPCPVGVPGDLYIGGDCLADGYAREPELTAGKFLPDPWGARGARLYRTGDRARYRPDGNLEFLGRLDHQVKIRGFRIELGEIEAALLSLPGVREAVVMVREGRLVAYVTGGVAVEALRPALRERLPEPMVPSAFVTLPALPLTPNGKVDRKALPAPEQQRPEESWLAPRTPGEEVLAGIWADLLGVERIGAADHFFDLGGHSLLATQVMSRLREAFGVELPLRELFEAPVLADLAVRVEAARKAGTDRMAPPLVPQPRDGALPLSFAQQRLWLIDQLEPGSPLYNIPVALRVEGPLDPGVLALCLGEIVRRHEVLRTVFAAVDGAPAQVIQPAAPFGLPVIDLSGLPQGEREAVALAGEEALRPFDLGGLRRGPLLRGVLLQLAPPGDQMDLIAALTLHHIAGDGWSMGLLIREVAILYAAFTEGRPSPLPELPVQYADFALWQHSWLHGEVLENEISYWRRQLADLPPLLELPADRARPAVQSFRGAVRPVRLPAALTRQLQALSRREGATLFMVLLAGFQALLSRSSGQEDLAVGTPVAGRNRVETEGLIGFFVNTLVLRGDLREEPSFRELLGRVRETALAAHTHQDVPFERLVQELAPERSFAHAPLFQMMLVLQNAPVESLEIRNLHLRPVGGAGRTAKFDLTLSLEERDGELAGTVEHATDLFDGTTIDRLIVHFERLLTTALAAPERRFTELPLLGGAERQQTLVEHNDTVMEHGVPLLLPLLVAAQAARAPERIALEQGGVTLTAGELEARANRLARRLLRRGVQPEGRVAICCDRSPEMVVSLLAVWKVGAAWVPLEPDAPAARRAAVLDDAQPALLLFGPDAAEAESAETDPGPPEIAITPDHLAYVIYTSGSTGRPKGVLVSHGAIANRLLWMQRLFPLGETDAVLQKTPFVFDASIWEIFLPLFTGARLVLAPPGAHREPAAMAREVRERGVTVLQLVPSVLGPFLDEDLRGSPLRRLFCGGEALPAPLCERVFERLPGVALCNLYGPTECAIDVTFHPCRPGMEEAIAPLGRPLDNLWVRILDRRGQPVPPGQPGELCAGGAGLARGYLGRPDLTAERFMPDPYAMEPGARLYRTGDLVRRRPDGTIHFLGRIDHQVKIRGLRIELGEVESALSALDGVRQAAVAVREDRLVAWVSGEVTTDGLRQALHERLPDAMVPAAFVLLAELPMTPTGKVDRKALPAPDLQIPVESGQAPRTPTEQALAGIWAELLGLPGVSIEDDFFALGGHSLLAARVVSRIRRSFGVEIPLRRLFERRTIAALAPEIAAASPAGAVPPLVPQPREGDPPLSFAQLRLWFLAQLEPGSAAYNMPVFFGLRGRLDRARLGAALGEVVRRHEILRTCFGERERSPVQRIAPPQPVRVPLADLTALPADRREAEARRLAHKEAWRPFDLARLPLLRTLLVRLAAEEHALLVAAHHIVADGWSLGVLMQEVATLLGALERGLPSPLPSLPVQYADYALWQQRWLHGEPLEQQLAFWRRQLDGVPPALALPTDRPRPALQAFHGARVGCVLPAGLPERLRGLAQRDGATLFMVLLAGLEALLFRTTGQEDFCLGTPVAGRSRMETELLIGLFVNTLVHRADLSGAPRFDALLARVRETALAAQAHQEVPFEKLVEALQPERNLSHAQLFQVMLAFQNDLGPAAELPGLSLVPLELDSSTAKFDLNLMLIETREGVGGGLEYDSRIFDGTTAARLLVQLQTLLDGIAADPLCPVLELPLLPEAERHQVLVEWNDTAVARGEPTLIHELFEGWAGRTPGAVAAVCGGAALTYGELEAQANRLAGHLAGLGVGPGSLVGIHLRRGLPMLPAVLAVLKAGAAYVPLEVGHPPARLRWILEAMEIPCVLTETAQLGSLPALSLVICLDRIELEGSEPPPRRSTADDLAYVIFTSGSTGTPKGVMVRHHPVVNLLRWAHRTFDFSPADRVLFVTSLSFDLSVFDIFGLLGAGGSIRIATEEEIRDPERLLRALAEEPITFWDSAPAALEQTVPFLTGINPDPALRLVFLSGDWIPVTLPDRIRERFPGARVISLGGATEATVWSNVFPIGKVDPAWTSIPYGRPIENARYHVLDAESAPCPVGVPGDLFIAGDCLADGYAREPELTASKFLPDPWSTTPGARLYRTGDRARYRPDGNLEFLGRIDHQVKIRGFRIELGEIDAVLLTLPGVREAVVVVREGRLVAYVTGVAEADALRAGLRERLPEPMMPAAFVTLAALPLTANGKVDRKALPAPERQLPEEGWLAPRGPIEETLAAIWAEVLGVERVGSTDHFFDLGGHSLLATQVISRLRTAFGVELPLRDLFEAPKLADLAARIEAARQAGAGFLPPPLVPVPRTGPLPLSFAQQRLWFIDQLEPGSPLYNIPLALRVEGPLHAEVLRLGLEEIVRRHEALRTVFAAPEGAPVQVIRPPEPFELPLVDLSGLPQRDRAALRLAGEEALRPFDLARGPLFRGALFRLAEAEHLVALTLHHIAGDGWSMGILVREVTTLYAAFAEGRPSPLPELPVQYADFAAWQGSRLHGEVLEGEISYWRLQLAGLPPRLELPTDRPRPAMQSFHGAARPVRLPAGLIRQVETLSRREGATLFMVLLAAFQALLARLSGQKDLAVGTPVAGRNRVEIEGLIGFFVNTLVLRGDLTGEPTFRELLGRTRETELAAHAHQDVPFERLVQDLTPERSLSHTPLFQVMLVLQNAPLESLKLPDLRLRPAGVAPTTAKFDLTLTLEEHEGGLIGTVEHASDLFDHATIDRWIGHFERLLAAATGAPDRPVLELPLLGEAERGQILAEWNDTEVATAGRICVHELFERQARRTPEAIAVVFGEEELTYAELAAQAGRLGRRLRRLGVGPDVLVGLMVERSLDMIVGTLGILQAGGAYVPLDPGYPEQRLAFMLEDTRSPVLLTQAALRDRVPAGRAQIVLLDGDDRTADVEGAEPPAVDSPVESLAYVIFTSGSTGRPKGVALAHRPLRNLIDWHLETLLGGVPTLQLASLSFDASFHEMFACWGSGGTLVVVPEELRRDMPALARLLVERRIEKAIFPVVVLQQLAEIFAGQEELPPLREITTTGERLQTSRAMAALLRRLPGCAFHNHYGPSETHVATAYTLSSDPEEWAVYPSVGRPIWSSWTYVLEPGLVPAPVGVPGDLYIGGACLARGYLGRPDLTAQRFVPDPFGSEPGGRLYRTGDKVRLSIQGELEYMGRFDDQVKIRGFRIEPGEIEEALLALPGVHEAVVLAQEDRAATNSGARRLVAYVVGDSTPEALRRSLRERLPDYMVPSAFLLLSELPLTPNGKVDRRALPAPEAGRPEESYLAPRTPIEEVLAGIWAELLGLEKVGAADHFFDLGGHSLLATRVMSRLRGAFGVEMPLRELFEAPVLADLATRIEAVRRAGAERMAPPLAPLAATLRGGDLPLSFAQQRLWFIDQLEPGSPLYNLPVALRIAGPLDSAILALCLGEIVRRHEALRTVFVARDGSPVQMIQPAVPFGLPMVDLSGLPEDRRETAARALARAEAARPFDLAHGPLLRGVLVRLAGEVHVAALTMHHIVSDGWSMGILVREVTALYTAFSEGRPSPLPELPVQYADFAAWQRSWLLGEVLESEISFWRRQLADLPSLLALPTDRPRPAVQSFRGAVRSVRLPAGLVRQMQGLSRREGATLFMVLLAGFQALLSRTTGEEDLAVGTPVAGRNQVEIEGLIGFFVNTLTLRGRMAGDPPFTDLLALARAASLDAYAHQDVPFERLVEELQVARNLALHPVFQVALALQNLPVGELRLPGLILAPMDLGGATARLDLLLSLSEAEDGGLAGAWEYSTDLFDATTIERMTGHLATLLAAATEAPARRLSDLPLLTSAESVQLLIEWNDTGRPTPEDLCLHDLFAASAAHRPEALAATFEGGSLTYGGLADRAALLADRLRAAGIGPEALVGICLDEGMERLVAVLGVFLAGGAYLPLDPGHPRERLAFMIEDAGVRVVLTQSSLLGALPAAVEAVLLNGCLEGDVQAGRRTDGQAAKDDILAYVIYTSGSTGQPNGVMVTHRSAVHLILHAVEQLGVSASSRVLQSVSFSFDASVLETWIALAAGATLCIASREARMSGEALGETIRDAEVTVAVAPPAVLSGLSPEELPSLRAIAVGGDRCPAELANRWAPPASGLDRILNCYGPTESTIYITAADLRGPDRREPPIGRPVANSRAYVLDPHGRPVPAAVPGELHLAGPGLARGYLARPALTAGRFVPDPFGPAGSRLYRTGDLVRRRPEGDLEFLGRVDHQVKIRGVRIELGEIKTALAALDGVREAVVLAREDRLVAYVVGDAGTLRERLRERLPDSMVPSAFVRLDALPLTPHGKVDRKALPAPEPQRGEERDLAPRTPVEELLAGLFVEILGVERTGGRVSAHDSFFELGGHSLLATRMVSRVRAVFGVELPLRDLFEAPGLADLATRVEAALQAGAGALLPPLVPVPRRGPLPLSFAQQRLWLVDQLEPGSPQYNMPVALRIAGPLDAEALARGLGEVMRRHEVLRTVFADRKGAPVQVIQPPAPFGLPVVDLSGLPEREREARALALTGEEAGRPFDLGCAPLLRGVLLRLGEDDHVAALTLHHIAGDGWSMDVLVREVTALYAAFAEGRPSHLPELSVQYADFAVWQRGWLQGDLLDRQLDYWRARLAGLPPAELPADRPRPPVRSGRGASLPVALPGVLEPLRSLGRQEDATLFMTLLAAFAVLVHRQSGTDRPVLGTDIANRRHSELEGLIGLFVNQLVLSFDLSGDPTFREILRQVRRDTLEAYMHQDAPFERLVELLKPERDLSRTPLFQLKLVLQNAPAAAQGLRDLTLTSVDLPRTTAKFDLLLNLIETGEGIAGLAEYSTDLFEAATIARLLEGFTLVLRSVTERPDVRLSEIAAELARLEAQQEERRDQERRSLALGRARRRVLVDQTAS